MTAPMTKTKTKRKGPKPKLASLPKRPKKAKRAKRARKTRRAQTAPNMPANSPQALVLAASKIGRPSKYKPEYADQVTNLMRLGATDHDLARFFDVSLPTIHTWTVAHPDFGAALKLGTEIANDRTERSLYHRANGYSFESEKILVVDKEVQRVSYVEHIPPDVAAATFWLKNRRPEIWRESTHRTETHEGTIAIEHSARDEIARRLASIEARERAAGDSQQAEPGTAGGAAHGLALLGSPETTSSSG